MSETTLHERDDDMADLETLAFYADHCGKGATHLIMATVYVPCASCDDCSDCEH